MAPRGTGSASGSHQRRHRKPPTSVVSLEESVTEIVSGEELEVPKTQWHFLVQQSLQSDQWGELRGCLEAREALARAWNDDHEDQDQKSRLPFWKRISARGSKHRSNSDPHGLLLQDSDGRTPLHLALGSNRTPNDILLRMIELDPVVASVPDLSWRLPLHHAVVHRLHIEVLAELIEANPGALSSQDSKGLSPLSYAVDIAIRQTNMKDAPRTFWMPAPGDCPEARWQEFQGDYWGHVYWLLMSSATHPQTCLNVGDDKPMLVDALLNAAPPAVVSLLVGASTRFLNQANQELAFAGSTMYTCIHRHYPKSVLCSLAAQCPVDVRNVRDETGMGLVAAQFLSACFERKKFTDEWVISTGFIARLRECISNRCISKDPAFDDWWSKIEFLVAFCTGEKTNRFPKQQLLHAALTNPDVPPPIIQLLLALHPESLKLAVPDGKKKGTLPVHLAASLPEYIPRNYETPIVGESALDQVLEADPKNASLKHNSRLPLHIALRSGKTGRQLSKLIQLYPSALADRDPGSGLYPFQLLAAFSENNDTETFRWICKARNQYSSSVWKGLSARRKSAAVTRVASTEDLERLGTVFDLLRRCPGVVSNKDSLSTPSKNIVSIQTTVKTNNTVSDHFFTWLNLRKTEDGSLIIDDERAAKFDAACRNLNSGGPTGNLPPGFPSWLSELRRRIELNSPLETPGGSEQKSLLHMALSNVDVPPPVIRLLVAMHRSSVSTPVNGNCRYPLHLACSAPFYVPHNFEPPHDSVLEILLGVFPEASELHFQGRLPLHIAVESGKPWDELEALVLANKAALKVRDPGTGLFPFQLAALHSQFSPDQQFFSSRSRFNNIDSETRSLQLECTTSVFGLLRADPTVLRNCASLCTPSTTKGYPSTPALHSQEKQSLKTKRVCLPVQENNLTLSDIMSRHGTVKDKAVRTDISVFSNIDMMSTMSNVEDRRKSMHSVARYRKESSSVIRGDDIREESSSFEFAEDSVSVDDFTPEAGCENVAQNETPDQRLELLQPVYFQLRKKPRETTWCADPDYRPSPRRARRMIEQPESLHSTTSTTISVLSLQQGLFRHRDNSPTPIVQTANHSGASVSSSYSTLKSDELKKRASAMTWVGINLYGRNLLGGRDSDSDSSEEKIDSFTAPDSPEIKSDIHKCSQHSAISDVPSLEEDTRSVDMMWLASNSDPKRLRKGKKPVNASPEKGPQTSLELFLGGEERQQMADRQIRPPSDEEDPYLANQEGRKAENKPPILNQCSTVHMGAGNQGKVLDVKEMRRKSPCEQIDQRTEDASSKHVPVPPEMKYFDKTSMRWTTTMSKSFDERRRTQRPRAFTEESGSQSKQPKERNGPIRGNRKAKCLACCRHYREVLILPCSHLAVCRDCASSTRSSSKCPLCDAAIESTLLLF